MVSRNSSHTRPNSSLRSDINLCIKFFCCPLWLSSDIWLLIFALKSRAVRLGDFYNQLQVNSHVWKAGYADTCQSTVITANSLCVLFSKLKSPDICLKMLTQVNKIIWYINLLSVGNQLKNSGINISCTVIFLRNGLRFKDISDHFVRTFLSFWTQTNQQGISPGI